MAHWLAGLILVLKGYRVVGMRPLDLPSNWISLHPGLREDSIRALNERTEPIVRRFVTAIRQGRRDYRALWDLPVDIFLAPIAVGYYFVGRFIIAKTFIASNACDGCNLCVKSCPVQAVRMVGGRPYWTFHCESCMHCMNACPKRAIETAHGFIAVALIGAAVVTTLVHQLLLPWVPALFGAGLLPELGQTVLNSILTLLVLGASYALLHRALRIPFLERLVVVSSLTHFRFWRRYRAKRVKAVSKGAQ